MPFLFSKGWHLIASNDCGCTFIACAPVNGDAATLLYLPIIFETPAWWGGRAEEVARALNEGKTHL